MSNTYSSTPLAKKLGIKDGFHIQVFDAPKPYLTFFQDFPDDVQEHPPGPLEEPIDFLHVFVTTRAELEAYFAVAKANMKPNAILWISWPKKSSKIETDLDKATIRQFGLDGGLVDTKVAAVDADWSGHKFVIRVKDR
jgi:hypothetical protein